MKPSLLKPSLRWLDYAIWIALGAGLLYLFHARVSGPDKGTVAAPFELQLANRDGTFRLGDQKGKPVVMEVFASWCGACRRAAPPLAQAYREHGANATFIGVSVDQRIEDAVAAREHWGIPYDVAQDDGTVARAYSVSRLPTVIVIGKDGTIRHSTTGTPSSEDIGRWIRD